MVAFTVNGKAENVGAGDDTPLLWALREHLKMTGTKFGCGAGLCGACTPVKVIYGREDDLAAGRMRPMTAHKIDVGMDKDGKIVGWKHCVVGESAIGYTNPGRLKKSGREDIPVMAGAEIQYYVIPNWMADHVHEKRGARLAAWRVIGAGYTKFASDAAVDKLALEAKVDPVEYRIGLLSDEKAKKIFAAVAEMADWKRKRNGTALGVAVSQLSRCEHRRDRRGLRR